jgi:phosphoribosylaminoimidazole-succinocarboxamide synthase
MKLISKGKTKDVYALADGHYLLKFKDDATGEGGVFDPGANQVGLLIPGMGLSGLRLTDYFFGKVGGLGILTHHVSTDLTKASMTVRPAYLFGRGIEVICRFKAVGSFLRRYGLYAYEGQPLNALVEITLKDDRQSDPLINQDALEALGILTGGEYTVLKDLTQRIARLVRDELAGKGLDLYDIKLEFGKTGDDGDIMLIDEISAGSMRAYKDGKPVSPLELGRIILHA